jgi:ElaB/YqjD/DUF883 family membrane-anchored ribosome-binding protein
MISRKDVIMAENDGPSGGEEPAAARVLQARLERIQRELQAADRRARRLVVQRPLVAVALAVGAGYLLGRAMVRTR